VRAHNRNKSNLPHIVRGENWEILECHTAGLSAC
jgi:hypothetical protein